MLFPETFLHGMKLTVLRQTFNGGNFRAIGLDGQQRAGLYRLTVEHNGAGAADRCFAADVCAGQSGQIADEMNQQQARFNIGFIFFAVDGKRELHSIPPGMWDGKRIGAQASSGKQD
jgi:hypothetical protein